MRRTRVFAATCLLQKIAEAGRWLQLYRRLHHLFCMTSARAVAVLLVVTAAVVSVPMRLVLVLLRRFVVAGGSGECSQTRYRWYRRGMVEPRIEIGRPGHVMVVVSACREVVGARQELGCLARTFPTVRDSALRPGKHVKMFDDAHGTCYILIRSQI